MTTMKRKGKFTDSELIKLRQDADDLDKKAAAISAKAALKKAAVIEEMERRGTKAIEHGGFRVTYAQGTTVVYNEDRILADLSPVKRKLVTTMRLDKGLLLAAVQAGKIKGKFVDDRSTVRENAPYTRITKL